MPKQRVKCAECGRSVRGKRSDHRYLESGLENVVLRNVLKYSCECGWWEVALPAVRELHTLIAGGIAQQKTLMTGPEIRFLRTFLGFGKDDLGALLGVTPERVVRWEQGSSEMPRVKEMLLRLAVFNKLQIPFLVDDPDEKHPYRAELASEPERVPVQLAVQVARSGEWKAAAAG